MKKSPFLLKVSSLCLALALSGAALVGAAPAVVSTPPEGSGLSAERLGRMDVVMNDYVARKQVAGALVLLKRDGKDVFLKPYGMMDIEKGKPMRTDTIFRLASMSKAVTTVAALILYEEGKFLLKDPVSKYIPEFRNSMVAVPPPAGSPDGTKFVLVPAHHQITIRDLMTHSAGLTYGDGPAKELYEKAGLTGWYFADRKERIGELMRRLGSLPLNGQPEEAFMYGYATDLLGYLVEVVSGMPLDQFIESRITKPLGMTDTTFFLPPEKADRLMNVYGLEDGKLVLKETAETSDYVRGPRACFGGGAGLLSTANDYGRFLQMLLNGGELDGVRILSPKTVELARSNHVGDHFRFDQDAFGLGFWVIDELGRYGELGSEGSYGWGSAYFPQYFVDPKERMVGILLTQLKPAGDCDLNKKFKVLSYQALIK